MLTSTPMTGSVVVVSFPADVDDDDGALSFTFTTRVLPGARWERLLADHRSDVDGYDYDPETFPPAAIVESVTGWTTKQGDEILEREERQPEIAEALELWTEWPQWARMRLLRAIEIQNVNGAQLGKRRGRANGVRVPAVPATT